MKYLKEELILCSGKEIYVKYRDTTRKDSYCISIKGVVDPDENELVDDINMIVPFKEVVIFIETEQHGIMYVSVSDIIEIPYIDELRTKPLFNLIVRL